MHAGINRSTVSLKHRRWLGCGVVAVTFCVGYTYTYVRVRAPGTTFIKSPPLLQPYWLRSMFAVLSELEVAVQFGNRATRSM